MVTIEITTNTIITIIIINVHFFIIVTISIIFFFIIIIIIIAAVLVDVGKLKIGGQKIRQHFSTTASAPQLMRHCSLNSDSSIFIFLLLPPIVLPSSKPFLPSTAQVLTVMFVMTN